MDEIVIEVKNESECYELLRYIEMNFPDMRWSAGHMPTELDVYEKLGISRAEPLAIFINSEGILSCDTRTGGELLDKCEDFGIPIIVYPYKKDMELSFNLETNSINCFYLEDKLNQAKSSLDII